MRKLAPIAAYREQTAAPVIGILMCDDAPQFKLLAQHIALCWIHDGRHYKKLRPVAPQHKKALKDFLTQYWLFYHQLKAYKEAPNNQQASILPQEFDTLFSTKTDYEQLDERIAKTRAKRDALLLVLDHPELPLHNNASELAARVQARERDVSLHTMSEAGTKAKDTFMTISQTAKKLGISHQNSVASKALTQDSVGVCPVFWRTFGCSTGFMNSLPVFISPLKPITDSVIG